MQWLWFRHDGTGINIIQVPSRFWQNGIKIYSSSVKSQILVIGGFCDLGLVHSGSGQLIIILFRGSKRAGKPPTNRRTGLKSDDGNYINIRRLLWCRILNTCLVIIFIILTFSPLDGVLEGTETIICRNPSGFWLVGEKIRLDEPVFWLGEIWRNWN